MRQLTRRFGTIDPTVRSQITALPLPLLEALGEDLLDFAIPADVTVWLQTHQA